MSSRLPVISALSLAVLISATPTVVGQSLAPSRRGGFAGALAHAHYLSNPSSQVLAPFIKEPGNQTSDPLQWSQQSYPGGPDYDLNTMFPGIAALVEINGHSTGNDDIPEWETKPDGTRGPDLAQIGWMQIAVSVNNSAQGLPGSVIRRRTNFSPPKRNTPGAELIGYYFSESTGIDPSLPGVSLLEQSSEAIGFSAMPPSLPDQDISALDWGLGVQTTASGGLTPQLLFTHQNEYFFTVTRQSALDLNNHYDTQPGEFATSSGGTIQREANAATIYKLTWGGTSWTAQPEVYKTASSLGLNEGNDDVDAVAVNALFGRVIFSTQGVQGRSQLLLHEPTVGGHEELTDNGPLVARKLGSSDDTDDIDSVAIIDPGHESLFLHATHLATPMSNHLNPNGGRYNMGISVTRGMSTTGTSGPESHFVQVSGWGRAPAKKSYVHLFVCKNYNPNNPDQAVWSHVGTIPRSAKDEDVSLELPVPSGGSGANVGYTAVLTNTSNSLMSLSLVGVILNP